MVAVRRRKQRAKKDLEKATRQAKKLRNSVVPALEGRVANERASE
jgi:hypothetical protein